MTDYNDFFLLDGLSSAERMKVISSFPEKCCFDKGSPIYSSDRYRKAIGYIVKGRACAFADNGNNVVMKKFTPGMCFGAAAVFGNDDSYVSSITAETDIEIIFITEELLKSIFKEYPKTAVNYISFLSSKIRFLNSKLSVISCSGTEDTVYKYLVTVTDSSGYAQLPESMTVLSKMLGIGRASLYRSLDALESAGKILRSNNKIKVIKNEKTH